MKWLIICDTASFRGKSVTAAAALIEQNAGDMVKKRGASRRRRVVVDRNIEHRDCDEGTKQWEIKS